VAARSLMRVVCSRRRNNLKLFEFVIDIVRNIKQNLSESPATFLLQNPEVIVNLTLKKFEVLTTQTQNWNEINFRIDLTICDPQIH